MITDKNFVLLKLVCNIIIELVSGIKIKLEQHLIIIVDSFRAIN